jgi:multimeric flavodoxin WrbA
MESAGNVLGVVGSPRKGGNTHLLVSKVLEGAASRGAAVEQILLGDLAIRECDGCHVCWQGKECSKKDDMSRLYPRIAAADGIVFGTPVYWYGPTALMKGFVDRFVYYNCAQNRQQVKGKRAVIAIPYEEESPETAKPVVDFFEKCLAYLEMELVGRIVVAGVSRKGEISENVDALSRAYDLGASLALGGH